MSRRFLAMLVVILVLFSVNMFALAEDVIEIEFYQQNQADVDIFDEIISQFQEMYPNIRVKQVNLPEEESGMVLNTRIMNNDAPDIWNDWFSQDLFNKVDEGVIRDLTDSDILDAVNHAVLTETAYNSHYYMIPMTINFMGVYYNVDMFETMGLKVPTTQDEFWTLCSSLQDQGVIPIAAGDMDGWNLAHWVQNIIGEYMPSYSDEFLQVYDGSMSVAEMKGITNVADIIVNRSKYVQPGCLGSDSDMMISLFANQKAAMFLNGSWWMGTLNAAKMDFEYNVFPFPGLTADDTKVMSNADFSFVLSSQSSHDNQVAAETFVRWMLTDGAATYINQSGVPSALNNISSDSSRYKLLLPYLNNGLTFRMPYSGRWADNTYLDYTVAVQNLTGTGDRNAFYQEFTDALVNNGAPATYIK